MITKQSKKGNATSALLITLGVLAVIAIVLVMWIMGSYNTLVGSDVNVENQWGKVQSAYERRLDLIPNLVATVKGSAAFEQDTQTQIAAMRGGIKNAKTVSDMQKVDGQMSSLMSGINIQVEAYPDLKSTANFMALQDELAGTENRIKWERDNYNDMVKDYKLKVRSFPMNMIAGMFGFEQSKWDMFAAVENASEPVTVDFSK
jgi:LemA protein